MVPVVDGQRDGLQRVHGAHFALATGHIGVGQRQHDVFDNRQARQQVKALKDKANAQGANFGELVIVKLSWDGLIDALNQGQIDAIIAGMMDTAERRESINFSEPYRETTYGLMVLADSPYLNATSIQDFSGAAVLGQQGTALDDVIEQIEGVDHLSPVGSVPDMISRLQQGTCDAIVINVENAQGYLASNPNFRLVTFDEGSGFTLPAKGSCVGLRKSDNELLDQINTILSGIDDDARAAMWQAAVDGQPQ